MAVREHPNRGRPPRDQAASLGIRWANGRVSRHTYTAPQLKWELRGWDHDISTYWRTNGADDLREEQG